jgi:hypothetical protein
MTFFLRVKLRKRVIGHIGLNKFYKILKIFMYSISMTLKVDVSFNMTKHSEPMVTCYFQNTETLSRVKATLPCCH